MTDIDPFDVALGSTPTPKSKPKAEPKVQTVHDCLTSARAALKGDTWRERRAIVLLTEILRVLK
jgi:hypothetical protein